MVPSLSASEKLNTNGTFILTLFGIELESSPEQQDTDIILEGQDLVLPRAANMTALINHNPLHIVPTNSKHDYQSIIVWLYGSQFICI